MQILGKCNSTSKFKIYIKVSDKVVNAKSIMEEEFMR